MFGLFKKSKERDIPALLIVDTCKHDYRKVGETYHARSTHHGFTRVTLYCPKCESSGSFSKEKALELLNISVVNKEYQSREDQTLEGITKAYIKSVMAIENYIEERDLDHTKTWDEINRDSSWWRSAIGEVKNEEE